MEVVTGGVGDHVGNHRQLAFLSRRGFVQPLHRDRHGGVVAPEGAHEGALEIGSQVVVLDRWIGQPIPESQRQEKHSREGQQYQRNEPGKPSRKLHRSHAFLPPGSAAWAKKSCSSLRAFCRFWASAWSRIFSTESGNNRLPSAPARAVAWNRFARAYRVAISSANNSSIGSAGRSRADRRASSRNHSASDFPSRSAAFSTSCSSSGLSRVATVLARRPGRAVSVGEDGGMREALIVSLRRKGPAFTHFTH